jgi:hypothetical protein
MPAKKYHVELTVAERTTLEQMLRRGKHSARRRHASAHSAQSR